MIWDFGHRVFQIYEIALGLEYLHEEGISHGDLRGVSPSLIFMLFFFLISFSRIYSLTTEDLSVLQTLGSLCMLKLTVEKMALQEVGMSVGWPQSR